jgi:CheY-like chemotaxis protein
MKIPVFARRNVYHCDFCGASNHASENRWCACGVDRSLVCRSCAQCFCASAAEWQAEFWRQAPDDLRARHLLADSFDQPAADPYASCTRPCILVVDDDAVMHSILVRVLAGFPGTVLHARNGRQALAIARRVKPDLLLTDALIPGVDGRVVAKTLKEETATAAMRVAVMTGLYKGSRYRGEAFRDFHADAYLEKPVEAAELWAVIEQTLHVGRVDDAPQQQAAHG